MNFTVRFCLLCLLCFAQVCVSVWTLPTCLWINLSDSFLGGCGCSSQLPLLLLRWLHLSHFKHLMQLLFSKAGYLWFFCHCFVYCIMKREHSFCISPLISPQLLSKYGHQFCLVTNFPDMLCLYDMSVLGKTKILRTKCVPVMQGKYWKIGTLPF